MYKEATDKKILNYMNDFKAVSFPKRNYFPLKPFKEKSD